MEIQHSDVLGTRIARESIYSAIERISEWARIRESRAVFFCNVHSVTTAMREKDFASVLAAGDACYPDGAPVAWMAGRLASTTQERVSGPDVMHSYLLLAAKRKEVVFLYGSTPEVLELLSRKLKEWFPELEVFGYSPPFRDLTPKEDDEIIDRINRSGARTVWVALGCPKQERWISEHKGRVTAVMLGVGAAFAFHAGVMPRAPLWMRKVGLEWLHRLASDPKRLWRRYLYTNIVFVAAACRQLVKGRATAN